LNRVKQIFKTLWKNLRLPEMLILPGNLAFYLILALPPIVSLFGIITASINIDPNVISDFIGNALPVEVVEIIMSFLTDSSLQAGNIIFVIIGIYIASNGSDSLIVASNVLYKTKNNNYIARRLKALFMTFWLLLLFIVILLFMAFGGYILNKLVQFSVIGKFISNNYIIINLIKTLGVFLVTFLTIKILYAMAPDMKIKSKFVNMGAFFATISIMLVTTVFSFYVNNFAKYNILYGSLASIAILMLLIYIISYIIVLGIAINHSYYKTEENVNKED